MNYRCQILENKNSNSEVLECKQLTNDGIIIIIICCFAVVHVGRGRQYYGKYNSNKKKQTVMLTF